MPNRHMLNRKPVVALVMDRYSSVIHRAIVDYAVRAGWALDATMAVAVNVQSVVNCLSALTDAQLFFRVPRYDIRGKRHLEINDKFYATDLGLRHSQVGFRDGDISGILENFQVTLHLDGQAVVERETAPLLAINDNRPKTIITLDRVHGDSTAGIRVASLTDFLSEH